MGKRKKQDKKLPGSVCFLVLDNKSVLSGRYYPCLSLVGVFSATYSVRNASLLSYILKASSTALRSGSKP